MKTLDLAKIITFHRLANGFKIYSSYYISVLLKKPFVWGNPLSISIEPSSVCNLHCPECPTGKGQLTRDKGLLSFEKFVKYFSFFEKDIFYLTLNFQGEPLMNKDFSKMIAYAKSKKVFVSTSTNAHFLNDENSRNIVVSGLDSIIVSIDGVDKESYNKYRLGGDFEKVMSGIKKLVDMKIQLASHTPHIILQFIVFKHNEHQLQSIRELASDLQVNELQLKSAQIYDFEKGSNLIPDNEKYSRYIKNADGKYCLKKKVQNKCLRMWKSLVVTWDGTIVPCCFDKDALYNFGNLNNSTLQQIRHDRRYYSLRKQILTGRKEIGICKNCTE